MGMLKLAVSYFRRFKIADWVTFVLCCALPVLTLFPIFLDVPSTGGWLRTALISLGAATLSAIVLSQIDAREVDKNLSTEISNLRSLMESTVEQAAVHEIPANQVKAELDRLLDSTNEWYFRGGSARWQREAVLPRLAKIRDRPVVYKIQIISPFDADLCSKYANYRRKSRPEDDRSDPRRISYELLAFLYAVSTWASVSKISPSVTLLHRFSPFRLDGNSESIFITVADLSKNGLRTNAGNWYHASLLDEFEFEAGHSTPFMLPDEVPEAVGVQGLKNFCFRLRELNVQATSGWSEPTSEADWALIYRISGVPSG